MSSDEWTVNEYIIFSQYFEKLCLSSSGFSVYFLISSFTDQDPLILFYYAGPALNSSSYVTLNPSIHRSRFKTHSSFRT